jgi:hypothetical protein
LTDDFASMSWLFGVRQYPDPVPPVVSADSRSRNNDRPAGVAERIQVSEYPVKAGFHTDDSRSVLTQEVARSEGSNNSRKFRPEIAVVVNTKLLSGDGERLTWPARGEEVDFSIADEPLDVTLDIHSRPVLGQHAPAKGVDLHELHGFDASRPGGGKREAAINQCPKTYQASSTF